MTDDERLVLCDRIEELVAKLRDASYGPDLDNAKVVWPPNKEMSHDDAIATLFDIEDCDLSLTLYDETGNALTDTWFVVFSGTQLFPGSRGQYARKPLKELIEEELQLYIVEHCAHYAPAQLLARLVKAFDEPEA